MMGERFGDNSAGKIWVVWFCLNIMLTAYCRAQCPVATVTVNGRVEQPPRGARVEIRLIYPKKEHEDSAEMQLEGDVFRIPVEFLTESRRSWLVGRLGERCERKPKSVMVTLMSGDQEYGRLSLDFLRDFEKSDPSNYMLKREVVLVGGKD